MAVYLYQSESLFEEVMNDYMVTGRGINPYNPRGLPFLESNGTVPYQLYEGAIAPTIEALGVVPPWAGKNATPEALEAARGFSVTSY